MPDGTPSRQQRAALHRERARRRACLALAPALPRRGVLGSRVPRGARNPEHRRGRASLQPSALVRPGTAIILVRGQRVASGRSTLLSPPACGFPAVWPGWVEHPIRPLAGTLARLLERLRPPPRPTSISAQLTAAARLLIPWHTVSHPGPPQCPAPSVVPQNCCACPDELLNDS